MNKIVFSHKSDNWATPSNFYDFIMSKGFYDPCPFLSTFDSLQDDWLTKNYVNPPFSKISQFISKAICEYKRGKTILMLLPVRTDTRYFKQLYDNGCTLVMITGRLRYNDSSKSAPFPSCLVILKGFKIYKGVEFKFIDRDGLIDFVCKEFGYDLA